MKSAQPRLRHRLFLHFFLQVRWSLTQAYVYMEHTDPDRSKFRGIVIAGAASERAMAALRFVLHETSPYASKTQFYDTVLPASIFNLGAAIVGRNKQLWNERQDCECMMDEDRRCPGGKPQDLPWTLPFDNEFPCNQPLIFLDDVYY